MSRSHTPPGYRPVSPYLTVEINDVRPERPPQLGAVHVFVPDVDATYRSALAAGATSLSEPENAPFGQRIAAVRHSSGTCWYLSAALPAPG